MSFKHFVREEKMASLETPSLKPFCYFCQVHLNENNKLLPQLIRLCISTALFHGVSLDGLNVKAFFLLKFLRIPKKT